MRVYILIVSLFIVNSVESSEKVSGGVDIHQEVLNNSSAISRKDYQENRDFYYRNVTRAEFIHEKIDSLMAVWLYEEDNTRVLLLWWSCEDPQIRKTIVALYECLSVEPRSFQPHFRVHSERFKAKELVQRKAEIESVVKKRAAWCEFFLAWIDSSIPKESLDAEILGKRKSYLKVKNTR